MLVIAKANKSFQWMLSVGVKVEDVQWMEQTHGTLELHFPANAKRLEAIYDQAINAALQSPQRVDILRKASLN